MFLGRDHSGRLDATDSLRYRLNGCRGISTVRIDFNAINDTDQARHSSVMIPIIILDSLHAPIVLGRPRGFFCRTIASLNLD